ncbi:MAG: CRISPR-associated protein Cas4 [Clostridiaceae bacterium]|nr:CRISPR-associated protein Cas4 [Clostridiaceae bacterium]
MIKIGCWEESEYLMISGIQHFIFCRRQWALIHIEQAWEENYFTTHGILLHERVDQHDIKEKRGDTISVRGMSISSYRLGMSGRCDLVEFKKNEKGVYIPQFDGKYIPYPVEYKRGKVKRDDSDRFQLLAQIMSLEDMLNIELSEASVFYHEVRRRTSYSFTNEDKQDLIKVAEEMHQLYDRGYTPRPKTSKKCLSCSLKDICLPELDKIPTASDYIKERIKECENS